MSGNHFPPGREMQGGAPFPLTRRGPEEVPLAAVDLEDLPFSPGPPRDLAALAASLAAVGVLAPPHLREKSPGAYQVVAGRRRLAAARELGWPTMPAYILPAGTPEVACLLLSLHDNAAARPLNPWEQAFYAARLAEHFSPEEVTRRYLPLLGLAPAPRLFARLVAAAGLADPWPSRIAAGSLSLSAAARLARWPPPARAAAWPFLGTLPFSHRTQEEFLEGLELLARRRGVEVTALLLDPEISAPLADPALSPGERAEAVRRRLKELLFPELTRAMARFREGLKTLGLAGHPRLRLEPPPALEGPDFLLTLKFADARELKQLLAEVEHLAAREAFARLVEE